MNDSNFVNRLECGNFVGILCRKVFIPLHWQATVYKALMTGDNSNVESAHLNVWSLNQAESINRILDYVLHFSHPQAEIPAFEGGYSKQLVTPTNLVSGNELPMVMGFPKNLSPSCSRGNGGVWAHSRI